MSRDLEDWLELQEGRGVVFLVDGDLLRWDAPAGVVTTAVRETLRARKAELIELLRKRSRRPEEDWPEDFRAYLAEHEEEIAEAVVKGVLKYAAREAFKETLAKGVRYFEALAQGKSREEADEAAGWGCMGPSPQGASRG